MKVQSPVNTWIPQLAHEYEKVCTNHDLDLELDQHLVDTWLLNKLGTLYLDLVIFRWNALFRLSHSL